MKNFFYSFIFFLFSLGLTAADPPTATQFAQTDPVFFVSDKPAVLVLIDGDPVMKNISDDFQKVINSQHTILFDKNAGKFLLNAAGLWFESSKTNVTDIANAKWSYQQLSPEQTSSLKNLIPAQCCRKSISVKTLPKIIISTQPAELIQTSGKPEFKDIPKNRLSFLRNSDSDIFKLQNNNHLYLLVSGRWFTAEKFSGPWKRIPSIDLPEDFRELPYQSSKWHVLSCIAETKAAKETVKLAETPVIVKIKRKEYRLKPNISGTPAFKPLAPGLDYAVNTTDVVIKADQKYFFCHQAVWLESQNLNGPWVPAVKIPAKISSINPDKFIYPASFVKINRFDDDFVWYSHTSGYNNSFVQNGTLVYGTGFSYPSTWNGKWFPRPVTYGYNIGYDTFEKKWLRCNRYSEKDATHINWSPYAYFPKNLPMQAGNYYQPPSKMLPSAATEESEEEETPPDPIKEAILRRKSGDWNTPVEEAFLEPSTRVNTEIIPQLNSQRINTREGEKNTRNLADQKNSRQRGVSKFERYRTYNSRTLKQSYGGGRSRGGTISTRGQFERIFKERP